MYCAVRQDDGTSPAEDFLLALQSNSLPDDPESAIGSDEQASVFAWFLDLFQSFADSGVPSFGGAVNYLTDGIWEFKRRNKRITFYDTDGTGGFSRKARIKDFADRASDDENWWWFPNFDPENVRLGHSFLKASDQTAPKDLADAEEVREEDLKNDRP